MTIEIVLPISQYLHKCIEFLLIKFCATPIGNNMNKLNSNSNLVSILVLSFVIIVLITLKSTSDCTSDCLPNTVIPSIRHNHTPKISYPNTFLIDICLLYFKNKRDSNKMIAIIKFKYLYCRLILV